MFKSWAVTAGPSNDPLTSAWPSRWRIIRSTMAISRARFPRGSTAAERCSSGTGLLDTPRVAKTPEQSCVRRLQILTGRRASAWQLGAGPHEARSKRRQANKLAAHQASRCERALRRRRGAARGGSLGGLGPRDERDRGGQGPRPKPFMMASAQRRAGRCGLDVRRSAGRLAGTANKAARGSPRRGRGGQAHARFRRAAAGRLVNPPPVGDGWGHEVKLDGYRLQFASHGGKATLKTRTALDWTGRFSAIADEAAELPDCLIDGEVVVLAKRQVPNFSALQAALSDWSLRGVDVFRFRSAVREGARICVHCRCADERRGWSGCWQASPDEHIRYVRHLESRGRRRLEIGVRHGARGHRLQALGCALPVGTRRRLEKIQVPCGARGRAGRLDHGGRDPPITACGRQSRRPPRLCRAASVPAIRDKTAEQFLPQLEGTDRRRESLRRRQRPAPERNVRWLRPRTGGRDRVRRLDGIRNDPAGGVQRVAAGQASRARWRPNSPMPRQTSAAGQRAAHRGRHSETAHKCARREINRLRSGAS